MSNKDIWKIFRNKTLLITNELKKIKREITKYSQLNEM